MYKYINIDLISLIDKIFLLLINLLLVILADPDPPGPGDLPRHGVLNHPAVGPARHLDTNNN